MIDDRLSRKILIAAAILGATAVLIGAFGAHGLPRFLENREIDRETIERRVAQFDTAARYHLIHSVALLALASIPFGSPLLRKMAAALFIGGIVMFSGTLYVLVLGEFPFLGRVVPIGGVLWILAWLSLIPIAQKDRVLFWSTEKKFHEPMRRSKKI